MPAKKEFFFSMVKIINLNDQYLAVHPEKFVAYVDSRRRRSDVAQSVRADVNRAAGSLLAGPP
jgi:hypothetical protein